MTDSDIVRVATRITTKQLSDIENLNKLAKEDKELFVKRLNEEAKKQKELDDERIKKLDKALKDFTHEEKKLICSIETGTIYRIMREEPLNTIQTRPGKINIYSH